MSSRCRKAFCASIGRFLGRLALARGVTAEGELEGVVRRLREVSGSAWCMVTCYTGAGMESNWVSVRSRPSKPDVIDPLQALLPAARFIISRLELNAGVNPSLLVKSSPAHCKRASCQRRSLVASLLPSCPPPRLDLVEQLRRAFLASRLFFGR